MPAEFKKPTVQNKQVNAPPTTSSERALSSSMGIWKVRGFRRTCIRFGCHWHSFWCFGVRLRTIWPLLNGVDRLRCWFDWKVASIRSRSGGSIIYTKARLCDTFRCTITSMEAQSHEIIDPHLRILRGRFVIASHMNGSDRTNAV